jgi:recombination DNA repair RAD52 pathway protein
MSKKHFIELANRIKQNRGWFTDDAIDVLADFCQSQNGNFKRDRWLAFINNECGPNGGKIK